jgi:hypothetical protein
VTGPVLRALPTLTGGVLALGLGSLLLGGICADGPDSNAGEFLMFASGLWVFVAAGIFVANEAWRDRPLVERVQACGWSLATAFAMLALPLTLLTVAVWVLEALGGHL